MKFEFLPGLTKSTLNETSAGVGQLRSSAGESGSSPASSSLTRSQRLAVEQRRNVLKRFQELRALGMRQVDAAKSLRVGVTTLWRWSRRSIIPKTNVCHRPSAMEKFNPPAEVLARVRQLQLTPMSNSRAWKLVAEESIMPPKLASHVRNTKTVSPSLLAATKLTRRKATIIEGPEFEHIVKA